MISKHIRLAFRQILRQKFSFAIAILGFAVGLAVVAHLISYSLYYLDYDRNVENKEEWYRLRYSQIHPELGEFSSASFFIPPAKMLLKDIPEVQDYIVYWPSVIALNLRCDGKPFQMEEKVYVSENFPRHYKMEIIYGDPDSLLNDRNGILISESFSRNFFGDVNPVGKKIYAGGNPQYFISGVFTDLDSNLHLRHDHYSLWYNEDEYRTDSGEDWYLTGHVRVKIPDKEDKQVVEHKLNEILDEYRSVIGQTGRLEVNLDPISKIHFITGLKDDAPTMSILNIYSILVLSFMFLLTAVSNFFIIIGLSWKKRGDEFYFRRALGAGRADIFGQLLGEYGLYFVISVLLGVILYTATMSIFRDICQVDVLSYSLFTLPHAFYGVIALLSLAVLSGVIMSLHHSKLILEQSARQIVQRDRGISILLVVQMIIGFIFIAVAVSVSLQYSNARNLDWCWDSQNTIQYEYLSINDTARQGYYDARILRQRIREIPGVQKESVSNFNLVSKSLDNQNGFHEVEIYLYDSEMDTPIASYLSSCTPDFFRIREIELLSGNIPDEATEAQAVVNRSFADKYLTNPLGSRLRMATDDDSNWYEVVAVVEDCWFFPPHHEMIPMIMILNPYVIKYYQISWQEGSKHNVLPALEELFTDAAGGGVFGYTSKDIELAQAEFYVQDRIYKDISLFMAIFVVIIAVMGVYAVSSVSIHAQMKDISIRKICGAEFSDLFRLYLKKYIYLYILAAIPGMYLAHNLISLYADRFAMQNKFALIAFPAAIIIMIPIVFIPLYLNILKAYKADPTRYLQAD